MKPCVPLAAPVALLALLTACLSFPALVPAAPAPDKPVPCFSCREPIFGESVMVKGRYFFHPAHFVCSQCKAALADREFFWNDDTPWCRNCYEAVMLPKCDVCGEPISDVYATDGWGNRYHARHEEELPRCSACGRLVSARLTGGGGRYDDGRAMCLKCRESAVSDGARAQALLANAAACLETMGVKVSAAAVPVRLVSLPEFEAAGGSDNTAGRIATAVVTRVDPGGKMSEERIVKEIMVLHGLPEKDFVFVAIHELLHAHLHAQARVRLDPLAEEGVATLASWLWARDRDDPLCRYLARAQEERNDAYGRRFREARKRLDWMPFRQLVERVAETGMLP
jgi:hypothetical protein